MRRLLLTLAVLGLSATTAASQARPDLSGTWALDRSSLPDPAALPPEVKVTLQVRQAEKTLTFDVIVASPDGEQKRTTSANLDGTPSKNTFVTPMATIELMSTFTWEGSVAVVTSKADIQGQAFVETDRFALEEDGKALRYEANVTAGALTQNNKLLFRKQ